ncbi:LOW QUALITY PROTEIN: ACT domain-containing protein ACR3-like [Dioscorea cayenensis subsp. rotundata]|uniref:ACT domain-containing protein ACR n=1 Tax=Dioscorea cayennensis subsp. rotundata TaxID=55577 RepID=A0AB40CC95_DIOCR|nr:LOW QUALITY PROTEIN: ACT domain-containing protein ACR3-like [Dioscorea cayenensis subsp. rotundata]
MRMTLGDGFGGAGAGGAYFDPDFDSLIERIQSPRVCIDNETRHDCTLVKVDSANRPGILLEMVQVLTDLDLVISKSYISSDGGWLMDVFHVTDHQGKKLTDQSLILYIQQSLVVGRKESAREVRTCLGEAGGPRTPGGRTHCLEFTAADRPGLLSEVSAVLVELDCHVLSTQAWTHNSRAACIMTLVDTPSARPIVSRERLGYVEEQVGSVVGAHRGPGEKMHVSLSGPTPGRVHSERRLHQLMLEDGDYEESPLPLPVEGDQFAKVNIEERKKESMGFGSGAARMVTQVSVDSWKERGYSVVNVRSRDRPKLLFDTVCALTDMQYAVFHAAVSSHGPVALQEYYIRRVDGCTLDAEVERRRVTRCLVAAIERRVSHGMRLDVCMRDRVGLIAEITRAVRENGLSLARVECRLQRQMMVGSFLCDRCVGRGVVDERRVEALREQIGAGVDLEVKGLSPMQSRRISTNNNLASSNHGDGSSASSEEKPRLSLGSLLWYHIERLSNFGSIR